MVIHDRALGLAKGALEARPRKARDESTPLRRRFHRVEAAPQRDSWRRWH